MVVVYKSRQVFIEGLKIEVYGGFEDKSLWRA